MKRIIALVLFLALLAPICGQASTFVTPKEKFWTTTNTPLAGGTLTFYKPGTTTLKSVYSDKACTTATDNPYTLDAYGMAPPLYMKGQYKVTLKNSAGVVQPGWPVDGVDGVGSTVSISASDLGGLNAAIAAMGSTPCEVVIDFADTLTGNTTVPVTMGLKFIKGGSIDRVTYNIAINGPFPEDITYQIFYGTGVTTFGAYVSWVNPNMWGGIPKTSVLDTSNDDGLALKAALNTGKNVRLLGIYRTSYALYTMATGQIVEGIGAGWGTYPASKFVMKSGIVGITPTGNQRKVTTRRLYRASAGDPEDPAYGIVLHNEGEGVIYRNFAVYLECDYTDLSQTNNGRDWDIGVFNSRGGFKTENVPIIGPFRVTCYYQDATRSSTLPEFTSIDGVQFPDGTIASGADNVQHVGALWTGGRWGEGHLGAKRCVQEVAARGTITVSGLPIADETFVIDTQTFTFKVTRTTTGEVTIGATAAACVTNIVTAVNTDIPSVVTAADGSGDTVTVTADEAGSDGNFIVFTEEASNIAFSGVGTLGSTVYGVTGKATCSGDYYDEILQDTVADARGSSGSSDYSHTRSVVTGPLHHSGYRWSDPVAANPLSKAGYLAELTSSGASYIDGYAAIEAERFTKQTYDNCRFVSEEPFMVRLDHVGNIRFNDSHFEWSDRSVKSTAGAVIDPSDTTNYGYGTVSVTTNTGSVMIQAPSANLPSDTWFWDIAQTVGECTKSVKATDTGDDRVSSGRAGYYPAIQYDNFGTVLFKVDAEGIQTKNVLRFSASLNDDTSTYFDIPGGTFSALCFLSTNNKAAPQLIFSVRAKGFATDFCQALAGVVTDVTYSDNAILAGTTGTDAKLNISVDRTNQGRIYIENRLGAVRSFTLTVIK